MDTHVDSVRWMDGWMDGYNCLARYPLRGLIECAHVRHPAKGASPAMAAAGLGMCVGWFVIFARWLFPASFAAAGGFFLVGRPADHRAHASALWC